MSNFDQYKNRVNLRGETARARTLYQEKRELSLKAINSLSCKDCKVNGVAQKLIIDDGTLPYYKNVKSLPDEYFNAGDMIEWTDPATSDTSMWLMVSCDWDKEVCTYGKMQQCNYVLKWQNPDGTVVERWSVVLSASKYNNGEKYNTTIVVGSNQIMIYLPLDSETVKFKSDKRLMVDFNTVEPKCYDVTRVDTVTMAYDGVVEPAYDGKGCVLLVLTETEINPDTDRVDLMLCNYINPSDIPQAATISYSGKPEVRIGGRKTFTANVENPVFTLIVADVWAGNIQLTQTDNKAVVKCANVENMCGASFRIECAGSGQRSSLLVSIIGAV